MSSIGVNHQHPFVHTAQTEQGSDRRLKETGRLSPLHNEAACPGKAVEMRETEI